MQASKIIPGKTYAVHTLGALKCFRVDEVITTTRRHSAHGSNSKSMVEGTFNDSTGLDQRRTQLSVDSLLGEYTEYQELVERKRAEEEAYKQEKKAASQAAISIAEALTKLAGLPISNNWEDPRNKIKVGYNGVTISKEAYAPLLAALKQKV